MTVSAPAGLTWGDKITFTVGKKMYVARLGGEIAAAKDFAAYRVLTKAPRKPLGFLARLRKWLCERLRCWEFED